MSIHLRALTIHASVWDQVVQRSRLQAITPDEWVRRQIEFGLLRDEYLAGLIQDIIKLQIDMRAVKVGLSSLGVVVAEEKRGP